MKNVKIVLLMTIIIFSSFSFTNTAVALVPDLFNGYENLQSSINPKMSDLTHRALKSFWANNQAREIFVDINGDGLVDLITTSYYGERQAIAVNNGNFWFEVKYICVYYKAWNEPVAKYYGDCAE